MNTRWIGIIGVILILTSLVLGTVGPQMFPTAFRSSSSMNSGGMMSGGMMGGMMSGGMMSGKVEGDPSLPFDQRFLDQMIMHHQGAVMSAQMMIANSGRPELRDLAQRIITGQQREIEQMQQWRSTWYASTSARLPQDAMIAPMGGSAMMNGAQMRQMMGANADVDRMFLQMMIPHHETAIAMARQALTQAEHPEIVRLAQSIITTQQAEIQEMQGYLNEWYGGQGK